jgi:hypothetical protein
MKPSIECSGYCVLSLPKNGKVKLCKIHRLVAEAFLENADNKPFVDHKDGDKLNNNLSNLRWATVIENARNSKIRSDNTSGVKGVSYHAKTKKWQARITIDGKDYHLGYYSTIEEAKQARFNKANEVFGEFKNICEN